jgi:hypothetical protein
MMTGQQGSPFGHFTRRRFGAEITLLPPIEGIKKSLGAARQNSDENRGLTTG